VCSAPCTWRRGAQVSWLRLKTGQRFVTAFGLKTTGMVSPGLASKPVATVSLGLASKRWLQVSLFGPQNQQLQFGDLGLKITVMVSWFEPQNQVGYGLSVAPQNRQEDEDHVGQTSRSSGFLHVEASQARVFQSGLKTSRGVMVGAARGTITEVM
jgi:hypothetical protein